MLGKKETKFILNKAFFGKINCLKILMNTEGEVYFHLGLKDSKDVWNWKKVKMSDSELGDIVNVLNQKESKCSFYHSFKDVKTQIWCNKSENSFNIKIGDASKNLTIGEFEVLRILIEKCVIKMNFK
jgi:hypothetical protein